MRFLREIFTKKDIFESNEDSLSDSEAAEVLKVIAAAIDSLVESRAKEGAKLCKDLLSRLTNMDSILGKIKSFASDNAEIHKTKTKRKALEAKRFS